MTAVSPHTGSMATIKGVAPTKTDTEVKKKDEKRRTVFNGDAYKARNSIVAETPPLSSGQPEVLKASLTESKDVHGKSN